MCDESFTKPDGSTRGYVQCSACLDYLHRECSGLSKLAFDAMVETAQATTNKKNLKYCCNVCDSTVTELLSNFQKFKKMQNELNKIQKETDDKIKSFERRIQKCETTSVEHAALAKRVEKLEETVPKIAEGAVGPDLESPTFKDMLTKGIQKTVITRKQGEQKNGTKTRKVPG